MKIFILCITFCFLTMQFVHSQNKKYGVIVGGNFSTLSGNFKDIIPSERRIGYHLGIFTVFKITDKTKLITELIYSSQGLKNSYDESIFPITNFVDGIPIQGTTTIGSEGNYILNYINLPVKLSYKLTEDLAIYVGPQVGFLVKARFKGIFTIDGVKEEDNSDLDFEAKFDYGGITGISYSFSDNINLNFSYFQGISNLNRKQDIIYSPDEAVIMRNSVFQLSVSYSIF